MRLTTIHLINNAIKTAIQVKKYSVVQLMIHSLLTSVAYLIWVMRRVQPASSSQDGLKCLNVSTIALEIDISALAKRS